MPDRTGSVDGPVPWAGTGARQPSTAPGCVTLPRGRPGDLSFKVCASTLFLVMLYIVANASISLQVTQIPFILRLSFSIVVLGVLVWILSISPGKGLAAITAALVPQKILLNQGFLLSSIADIEILALAFFFSARPRHTKMPGAWFYLVLSLYTFAHFLFSDQGTNAVKVLRGMAAFALFFYHVAPRIRKDEAIAALKSAAYFGLLYGILALSNYDYSSLDRLGESINLNSNNGASFAYQALIFSVFLMRANVGNRIYLWFVIILTAICILFFGSRTFVVVTAIGLLILSNPSRMVLIGGALLVTAFAVPTFVDLSGSALLQQYTKGLFGLSVEDMSTNRWLLTVRGMELYRESSFWGAGLGASAELIGIYREQRDKYLPIHNLYLLYLVEMGAPALAMVLLWIAAQIWYALWNKATLFLTLTFGFMITGLLSGSFFYPEYTIVWGVAALFSLPRRKAKSQ